MEAFLNLLSLVPEHCEHIMNSLPLIVSAAVYVTGTDYVELGDSIRLVCNATGVAMPVGDLDWYRNGVVVQSEPREGVLVTKKVESRVLIAVLFIHPSRQTHAGNYVCRASNDDDSATITVHIINGWSFGYTITITR